MTKDKEGENSEDIIEFWNSLWLVHRVVYFLTFIELILKILLLYYLIMDYKDKYGLIDLKNFNYEINNSDKQTQMEGQNQLNDLSNDIRDIKDEIGNNSFQDFNNDFEENKI